MPKIKTVREIDENGYLSTIHKAMAEGEEYAMTYVLKKNNRRSNESGRPKEEELLYCPNCKAFHETVAHKELREHKERYSFNVTEYECSECGTKVPIQNTIVINQTTKAPALTFPIWAGHFDEGDFVKFKWITSSVTGWNNKLQVENVYYYINFNTVTGQTYYFEPYVKPIKGGLGRRAPWYQGPRMFNCSYIGQANIPSYIPQEILWDLYNCIYQKIAANLGYNPVHLQKYFEDKELKRLQQVEKKIGRIPKVKYDPDEKLKFEHIILFNRMPNMSPFEYQKLINDARRSIKHKPSTLKKMDEQNRIIRELPACDRIKASQQQKKVRSLVIDRKVSSIKSSDPNPVKSLMENYKMPLIKSYRKILLENPSDIHHLQRICKYITDINNVRRVYEARIFAGSNSYSENNKKFARFMNEMSEKFTESIWVTKLISGTTNTRRPTDLSMVSDTADMYYNILNNMDKIKKKIKDFELDLTGSVKEMHDNFSYVLEILDHENIELREHYTEEDLKYECKINDYIIKLADDTHELRRVGKFMHICVGTNYSSKAARRDCNIALIKNHSKYVMCIELSADMKTVNQAKLECNQKPEGELKEVVTKWIQDLKLVVDTYDLPELRPDYDENDTEQAPRVRRRLQAAPAINRENVFRELDDEENMPAAYNF